ncbi:protein kinase domain-containing protein [Nocardia xishanensis]
MVESDPFKTQRDVGIDVVAELSAVGFEEAAEIGRGGFGVVYRCTQVGLDRTVAVKVLTGELDVNRERFFREQRAMGRLTGHPNIVGVLQVGETETGLPYLVMQYHPQGCLDARIRRDGPLTVEEGLKLGVKMAGALETAHRAGVLHRDMKPANILLTDYGQPALTDFGIAHIAGGFETATGHVTGTPAFTAPEVLAGESPSRASDVYGLGATLFCALTGHAAFERRSGERVVAQFVRIATQPIPDLREHGIPEDVSAVIEAAMSRDPRTRPTAAALGEQLQRVQLAHRFGVEQMALRTELDAEQEASSVPVVRPNNPAEGGGNLPLELTSFVDRRIQSSQVKNQLAGWRLVTLTGIGGVGKSRLALQVARKVQRDYSNGAWLVELGELRDAALLVDTVAAAFGVRSQSSAPMLEVLLDVLSPLELLLVLDNCEQMIEAVAELAESLLRACPHVKILATSREAMDIGGESVYPVPPLEFPDPTSELSLRGVARYDAVTLFAERAASAVPGFELTEDNRHSVAGICARLDGLPLAIELATARLRTMSAEQIEQRLTDRYTLLTRGGRGTPTRQQTLRWCIGWSYDLCTPAEQRLWGRLSVFAGSFDLNAAEAVCGEDLDEEVFLDALSALVEKSILIREEDHGAVRFRLLDTLQEYGREKITQADGYAELSLRHRDWYERVALDAETDWVSPRQLDWIARLERELPNLRKALEFSRSEASEAGLRITNALYTFWLSRGRLDEGRRWNNRALADSTDRPTVVRAKALYMASVFAATQGDPSAATGRVEELRSLAARAPDPQASAFLANADGFAALVSGDLVRASACLNDAADTFEACGELASQLRALTSLGLAYESQGDTLRAIECLEKVLIVCESHGETLYRSYALQAMGLALWQRTHYDRATHVLKDGIRAGRSVIDPLIVATCLEILAWIAAEDHDARRAAVLLGTADGLARAVGCSSIMYPPMLGYHEECKQHVQDALGARAYAVAHQKGADLGFDAAVGFALGEEPRVPASADNQSSTLTKREREVVDLVAEGLTNKAIAARLVISQRTAQGHVEHILTKLGFTSRAQIAAWAGEQARNKRA